MNKQYAELVNRMASNTKTISEELLDLNHAALGCCTEAAELADVIKKSIYYRKPVDYVNLKEELGDLLWYVQLFCSVIGTDFAEVIEINTKKLTARYGDKFTSEAALNRDLEKERKILEEGVA